MKKPVLKTGLTIPLFVVLYALIRDPFLRNRSEQCGMSFDEIMQTVVDLSNPAQLVEPFSRAMFASFAASQEK